MTPSFENMMYFLKCTQSGAEPEIKEEINLKNIYELSRQQGIWPLVFLSVKKLYENGGLPNIKPELIKQLNDQILLSVTKNVARKEILKLILDELREMKVTAVLLKGDSLADLYAFPEYRLSGDVDLLISEHDEEKIFTVFEKHGFNIEKRMNKEHHSVCVHPVAGIVELHVALYDDYCEEIWFEGRTQLCENYSDIETHDGYKYTVLGLNDRFIYTTMHMIKHFLSGGAGIRQVMDVLLFMKLYKADLDLERYATLMKELSFDSLMDCLMDVGVKYLSFGASDLFYINEHTTADDRAEKVLDDIEKCGLFGHNNEDLREFKLVYLEKKYKRMTGGNVGEYMNNRTGFGQKLKLVFIRRNILEKKYPYVKKSVFLVPVAWIHRIFNFIFKKPEIDSEAENKKETTFGQRVELLENLNIL